MERLGKPEISLSFEASCAGQHDGQSAHQEAWTMAAPKLRVCVSRSGEIEKFVFVVSTKFPGYVIFLLRYCRYRDKREARSLSQCSNRAQITRGLGLKPRERFLWQARRFRPARFGQKSRLGGMGHLVQQSRGLKLR